MKPLSQMPSYLVRLSALFSIALGIASLGACQPRGRDEGSGGRSGMGGEATGGRGGAEGGSGGSAGAAGVTGRGGASVGGGGGDAGTGGGAATGGSTGAGGPAGWRAEVDRREQAVAAAVAEEEAAAVDQRAAAAGLVPAERQADERDRAAARAGPREACPATAASGMGWRERAATAVSTSPAPRTARLADPSARRLHHLRRQR